MARLRIRFIINPKSGIGKQGRVERLIPRYLDMERFQYDICYTNAREHAIELSREAAGWNYDAVVAVGGDGSINEVVRGLLGSGTALGIIPAGSGNGLAHYLGISLRIRKALQIINRFRIRKTDTGLINGRPFVSICGTGFDAFVAEQFSKERLRGFWSYAKVAFMHYIYYNPERYKIYVNGKIIRRRAFMLSIANSDQFGFNARIAAGAEIDDGLLDVCIARKPRVYYALFLLPLLFLGWIRYTPFMQTIKTTHVKIIMRRETIAHIDGDEVHLGRVLEVEVVP